MPDIKGHNIEIKGNSHDPNAIPKWTMDELDALKDQLQKCINSKTDKNLKIWVPECHTGEEAYIIAILLYELLCIDIKQYQILIYATDYCTDNLNFARHGRYDNGQFEMLGAQILKKYFSREKRVLNILEPIRNKVFFAKHNLANDPVFEKFDFISCRNINLKYIQYIPGIKTALKPVGKLYPDLTKVNSYYGMGNDQHKGHHFSQLSCSELKTSNFQEYEMYFNILKQLPDPVFVLDKSSTYIACNQAALASIGLQNETDLIGKTPLDIFGPGAKPFMELNQSVLDSGQPLVNKEYPMYLKDKQAKGWAMTTIIPFIDKQGNTQGLIGISRDITQLKEAENRLHSSIGEQDQIVNRLTKILNTLPANVALIDEHGHVMDFNNYWHQFAKENDVPVKYYGIGSNHFELIENPKSQFSKALPDNLRKILKGKSFRYSEEFSFSIRKETRWFRVLIESIPDEVPTKAVIMYIDITELKQTELQKQEINERYRLAGKATNDAIWDWDLKTNKLYWGEGFNKVFGYETNGGAMTLESWAKHIHPDDYDNVLHGVKTALNNPTTNSWENEYRFYRSDGSIAIVHDRGYVIYGQENKPSRMVGAMIDITERKQQEEEKQRIIDDLVQRNKDLEQFTYITSHNLRAPVSNIIAISKLLQDENRAKNNWKIFLNSIQDSVTTLDEVIRDLNQILKVKNDIKENKTVVAFDNIVNIIHEDLAETIKSEKVKITTDFSAVNETLTVKHYLKSIFQELISNSIKYRRPGIPPELKIKSKLSAKNSIIISFSDNGLGIDLEKRYDQIFGLYKRFHEHADGKGLGLFMVKAQVEKLGGKISVTSKINQGTKFNIELPL